MSTTTEF